MKDVVEGVSALDLKTGGVVLVEPGDLIPSDVIECIASIDESANPHPINHRRTSLRGKFPANRQKLLRENLSDRTQQNQLVRGNFIRTGNLSLDDLPRPSRAARALCPSQNRGKEFRRRDTDRAGKQCPRNYLGSGPGGPPGVPAGGITGMELGPGTGAGCTICGSTPSAGLMTPPLLSNLSLRLCFRSGTAFPFCVPPSAGRDKSFSGIV
jgi:hypothetical protein